MSDAAPDAVATAPVEATSEPSSTETQPAASTDTPEQRSRPRPPPLERAQSTAIGPAVDTPTTPSVPLGLNHYASLPHTSDDVPPVPAVQQGVISRDETTATKDADPDADAETDIPANANANADAETAAPAVLITLLLVTGARHPFKIDGKYLKRRNVGGEPTTSDRGASADGEKEPERDPWSISVYTVKELILRDWRDEWDNKPSSPTSIRLIFFGKLLEDKTILKDLKLNRTAPNIVHMSIKPTDFGDEDDMGKNSKNPLKTRNRRGRNTSATPGGASDGDEDGPASSGGCCKCIVM